MHLQGKSAPQRGTPFMPRTKQAYVRETDSDIPTKTELLEERVCAYDKCGKTFVAHDKRQKYCDWECRTSAGTDRFNQQMKELRRQKRLGNVLPEANLETLDGKKKLAIEIENEFNIAGEYARDYVFIDAVENKWTIEELKSQIKHDIEIVRWKDMLKE